MNKIRKIFTVIIMTAMVILQAITSVQNVYAAPTAVAASGSSDILVSKYEVSNQKIIPGNDFTLTLTVTNYSSDVVANATKIAVGNPDGVAPVYGSVSQAYIGTLQPGESKEVSFDYNSWTTIVTDTVDFDVLVTASTSNNEVILRVPSSLDAPFKIDSVSIPEQSKTGAKTDVSLAFSVLGVENVSNIVMSVEGDDIETVKSNIGILSPGASRSQNTPIVFNKAGNYSLNVYMSYTNADGTTKKIKVYSGNVNVSQGEQATEVTKNNAQTTSKSSNGVSKMLVVGVSGILIIAVFVIILLMIYKKK